MITIQEWNAAGKTLNTIPADEALSRREELLAAENVLWIDLSNPSEDEERLIFQQFFPIHTLSLEDVTRLRREPDALPHLPKVEEFSDYLFVIVNPLLPSNRSNDPDAAVADCPSLTQLSAVVTRNVLITHHYAPLACIQAVHAFLKRHEAQLVRGPDFLFHLVLDHTVDEFVPVLDALEETLDNLETTVIARPQQSEFLRLLRLKRVILLLRKTLIAEREVLVRLARGEFELVDDRETVYYRNVYDHLVRFTELIESSREMVSDLMQTFLSAQANHLNQIMKLLTMISTVVLPMTLIAGVYGMNFDRLIPDKDHPAGFFIALAMMIATGVGAFVYFQWKRWS
jgi:magnesium transporter